MKDTKNKCSLCGRDKNDPSVSGCDNEDLYFTDVGPMKPIPNIEEIQCDDCGCKPNHIHHAGCSKEICPVCGYPYVGCPCGEENEPTNVGEVVKRVDPRVAFVRDLGVKLGRRYWTSENRVIEVVDIDPKSRMVRINFVDCKDLGVDWVEAASFKKWDVEEITDD